MQAINETVANIPHAEDLSIQNILKTEKLKT